MIGKEMIREHFQPRTCSGKKTPKTGRMTGSIKNIVLIDVDSDQVDDVVILDYPELLRQKLHGSSVPSRDRKYTRQSVISIDDDESDDADHARVINDGGGESDTDVSSSKRFSAHVDVDDCHVVYEKGSASHMPKSRQTCSAKDTGGNRYGLDRSESESSDSDCSDCELMEVREQWEKASVKRKRHVFHDQAAYDKHASSSGFHSNNYTDFEVENMAEQHAGSFVYSGTSNGKYVKVNKSSFPVMVDSQVDGINLNIGTENPCKDSDHIVDHESFKSCSSESIKEMQSLHRSSDFEHGERTRSWDFSPRTNYKNYNFSSGITGASRSKQELGGKESEFMNLSQEARERQVDIDGSALRNKDDNFSSVSFDERHANCDGFVSQKSCGSQLNCGLGAEEKFEAVPESSLFGNPKSLGKSRVCNTSGVEATTDSKLTSVSNLLFNDSQDKQDRSCLVESKNPSDVVDDALHTQDGGLTTLDERDIINEREKLKETDEYKRAIEEEWASRQQQLQIQAEEAQRLRKRKKAESQRLLDMQRRQKERIEEVRETQKKDEEFMNMKEQLRLEIRKGLYKLEMECSDMTSLLRGLGIQVGGGFNPLPNEVHAAYKRALFKFHPDRASKTDIREQVEAEEKFKLISRMKEKFLLTSC